MLSLAGARARRWTVQASLATLRAPFCPARVTVNGRRVGFAYDRRARVLRFGASGRGVRIVVSAATAG